MFVCFGLLDAVRTGSSLMIYLDCGGRIRDDTGEKEREEIEGLSQIYVYMLS